MHLYIITRGIKNFVDQFITELQGKYLPFKYQDDKGNLINTQAQVAVRPIQLWEIVFPEEQKDLMLNTILRGSPTNGLQHAKHKKFIWTLRKCLGVEKISEYKKDFLIPISINHTEIIGIGTKKDYWIDTRDKKTYAQKENEFCVEAL